MIQPSDAGFAALFYAHPVPMWVYDLETFRFVAVNAAAVVHYGYAEAEFLAMTLHDIRPPEEQARLNENLRQPSVPSIEKSGIWQHVKKDGTQIDVEITSHPLWFNERACRFVLAHDVTERLAAHDKIMRLSRAPVDADWLTGELLGQTAGDPVRFVLSGFPSYKRRYSIP